MKPLGQAAVDLPWLCPCAGALVALTRPLADAWADARLDPGCVLLLARSSSPRYESFAALTQGAAALEAAREFLKADPAHFVDWSLPPGRAIYQAALRQAQLAQALATHVPGCDPDKAWACGMLASVGWFALCSVGGLQDSVPLSTLCDPLVQRATWGFDVASIARRLARRWNLPSWLAAVVGHLGLPPHLAVKLGGDSKLFQITQFAVHLAARGGGQQQPAPFIAVPVTIEETQAALGLSAEKLRAVCEAASPAAPPAWEHPAQRPNLGDLLRLALEQRSLPQRSWIERLEQDLDQLQEALVEQQTGQSERLQQMKLAALAELAAGAGHEINNPLAVISGQAQYLLKQFQVIEETLAEETTPTELYERVRDTFTSPLHKIVGQTQRVHRILTDLMQFARPGTPKAAALVAGDLMMAAAGELRALADERRIRLEIAAPPEAWAVDADAAQMRTCLTALLRNAIEAAPADGWAGVRAELTNERVHFLVEDSGPGPDHAGQEHLFDPFYSGRSAGRGRGLGLSTAWRLAKQNGGEVRFAGHDDGVTRFVLSLPAAHGDAIGATNGVIGYRTESPPTTPRLAAISDVA